MKTANHSLGYLMLLAGIIHLSGVPVASSNPGFPDGLPVVEDLSVYLDAESVEASGSHVMGMLDRTGKGNHAWEVGVTPPSKPLLIQEATPSGLDAVRFDGLGSYAEVPSNPDDFDGRARTIFLVFRADDLTGRLMNSAYEIIDSWEPDNLQPTARFRTSEVWLESGGVFRVSTRNPFGDFNAAQTPDGSVGTGEFVIGVKEWHEGGEYFARVRNAADETFSDDGIGGLAEPEAHLHTRIGAGSNFRNTRVADFFGGDIGAVLIYNRTLSSSEREDVEEYLRETYLDEAAGNASPGEPPVDSGLVLHLNSMNLITDGEVVTEWTDVSGRGNHAPTYAHDPRPGPLTLAEAATPSGQDAIRFDGIGGYAEVPSNPEDFDGRAKTIIAVFRPEHLAGSDYIVNTAYEILDPTVGSDEQGGGRTRNHWMRAFGDVGGHLRSSGRTADGGHVGANTPDGSVRAGEFHIGINQWRENGDIASIIRDVDNQRFEGVASGADAEPEGHVHTRLGAATAFGDFEALGSGEFFEGEIAAFLIYNRELSSSELEDVESYLYDSYLGSGPGPNGPGDPPVLDDLVVHFNASNVAAEEGIITELVDISGRGNHAPAFVYEPPREGGPELVPGGTPSGRPTVRFDGSRQYLEIEGSPDDFDGRGKTTIAVFNADPLSDGRIFNFAYSELDPGSAPSGRTQVHEMRAWDNGERLRVNNRGPGGEFVGVNTPEGTVAAGEFYIGMNHWRDNGDTAAILINEANERYEEVSDGATAEPSGHIHTRIGAGSEFGNLGVSSHFPGEIAAFLVYNRELSSEELDAIEGYLFQRYIAPDGVTFADWIAGFDVPEGLDGPDDDASGDGVSNLLKYAIGADPSQATLDGLPTVSVEDIDEDSFVVLDVQKNPAAGDVSYSVEGSTDLVNWATGPDNVMVMEEDAENLRVRLAVPLQEEPKAFLRLRVSLED